ncbi:Endoribonuclease L-PSP/chorismate mutase-like protein [Pavlovales sp. CCMP2436]|nr:Endoribonuclease L-PSP/chorismate mutase-like protein [Pavlovales sp. CCMP2436]
MVLTPDLLRLTGSLPRTLRPSSLSRLSARALCGGGGGGGIQRFGTGDPRMSGTVLHAKSGLVFISGQTAADEDGVRAQTAAVLRKVDERLAAAGTDKSRVLQAQIWLKDIESDFAGMNASWMDWIDPANKPARATTQAPMARSSILVEVMVVAAVKD